VGSAQKNMLQRITRHLKKEKKLRWHIDYLTTSPDFKIKNCFISVLPKNYECKVVKQLKRSFLFSSPVKKFGSSDCTICHSHLLFCSEKQIDFSARLKTLKLGFISIKQKVNFS